jgi:hypothetical protein
LFKAAVNTVHAPVFFVFRKAASCENIAGEKKKRRKKMHTAQNIIGKDRIALLGFNP